MEHWHLLTLCWQHSVHKPAKHKQGETTCTPGTPNCRSKRGASTRDVKQSVELLKFAAGLVPAANAWHHAGSQQGSKQQPQPVQGFPHMAFNTTGRADALRELAKAYQVRLNIPRASLGRCHGNA